MMIVMWKKEGDREAGAEEDIEVEALEGLTSSILLDRKLLGELEVGIVTMKISMMREETIENNVMEDQEQENFLKMLVLVGLLFFSLFLVCFVIFWRFSLTWFSVLFENKRIGRSIGLKVTA